MHHFITQISLNLAKMRTKKMVRHSKRHSRKKGGKSGKRSRGRRQYGGMWRRMTEGWKSLITSDDNMVHTLPSNSEQWKTALISGFPETLNKGIDIKYRGSPPNRQWLIGGDDKTVYELFEGAKDGRYMDVIEKLRNHDIDLPDDQKGIILTDDEFCRFFIRYMYYMNGGLSFEHMMQKPMAYKYFEITNAAMRKLGTDAVGKMCSNWNNPDYVPPPPKHMLTAQRHPFAAAAAGPSAASRASAASRVSAAMMMDESRVSKGLGNHNK